MLKERITFSLFVLIVIMVTLFVAYSKRDSVLSSTTTPEPVAVTTEGTGKTSLANPASTFCVEHGGTLVPKKDEKGEYSMCDFGEKGVCEEWALFRGECSIPSVSVTAVYKNASSTVTVIYRGEKESSTAILDAPAFGYTDTHSFFSKITHRIFTFFILFWNKGSAMFHTKSRCWVGQGSLPCSFCGHSNRLWCGSRRENRVSLRIRHEERYHNHDKHEQTKRYSFF
jgi:putative hemolysin